MRLPLWKFFVLCFVFLASGSPSSAREWSDATGWFKIEADLITADDDSVVLKTADQEIVILRRKQLSNADSKYVDEHARAMAKRNPRRNSNTSEGLAVNPDDAEVTAAGAETTQVAGTDAAPPKAAADDDHWKLRNGDSLVGRLLGFGSQTLTLQRVRGKVAIDDVDIAELPAAYATILPAIVSRSEAKPVHDVEEIEAILIDKRGGPISYEVKGVQLELNDGHLLTIPIDLLAERDAKQVAAGFARWEALHASQLSEEEKTAMSQLERLSLEGLQRSGAQPNPAAADTRLIELDLLAATAGVTDIWQVSVTPNIPYAFPRSVVVAAENSRIAQQIVAQAYPTWVIGPTRKLSN